MNFDEMYINNSSKRPIIIVNNNLTRIYYNYLDDYEIIKNTIILDLKINITEEIINETFIITHNSILDEIKDNTSNSFFSCFENEKNINQVEAIINNDAMASSTYVFDSMTLDNPTNNHQEDDLPNNKNYGIYAFSLIMFSIGGLCMNNFIRGN